MVSIPDKVFSLYEDMVDDFINKNFGITCRLYYPPKKVKCTDCPNLTKSSGGSTNIFGHGGPAPFTTTCPACGGDGYKEVESFDDIKLRVYYEKRDFVKIADIEVPNSAIQVIGFYSDLPKFLSANEMQPNIQQKGFGSSRYVRITGHQPHGFRRDRYFVCYMEKSE